MLKKRDDVGCGRRGKSLNELGEEEKRRKKK